MLYFTVVVTKQKINQKIYMSEASLLDQPSNESLETAQRQQRAAELAPHAGSLGCGAAFEDVIKGFYDADSVEVTPVDGYILPSGQLQYVPAEAASVAVIKNDGRREHVAMGNDPEELKQRALERMRTLESVHTKPIIFIPMTAEAKVTFTSVEHYNPKMAPRVEAYPVPSYLSEKLAAPDLSDPNAATYKNTLETEGWQQQTFDVVKDFVDTAEEGKKMLEKLKITSLDRLTPEQAVKLSIWFVQSVSKYSYAEMSEKAGETASDQSTAMELLKDGIANKDDPNWQGNGICRNVAANVKVVFDSLKSNQGEYTMLTNTYCVRTRGTEGDGYEDRRVVPDHLTTVVDETSSGHAWNEFVTIDAKGSANITSIDATWGMDTPDHLRDFTALRGTREMIALFEKAEDKKEAFYSVVTHLERMMAHGYGQGGKRRDEVRDFALTEYLKLAKKVEPLFDDPEDSIPASRTVFSAAYRIGDRLTDVELDTLNVLQGGQEDPDVQRVFSGIVDKYVKEKQSNGSNHPAIIERQFLKSDDEFQTMIFDALGANVTPYAELSGKFRARLRELKPEVLPPFDPKNSKADAREFASLIQWERVSRFDKPEVIAQKMQREIRRLAESEQMYDVIVAGRSDYDLAKNFSAIRKALQKIPSKK
jgi:hypothetical protein